MCVCVCVCVCVCLCGCVSLLPQEGSCIITGISYVPKEDGTIDWNGLANIHIIRNELCITLQVGCAWRGGRGWAWHGGGFGVGGGGARHVKGGVGI